MVISKQIEILLVDDHQVVRDGLKSMLEQEADLRVTGQGEDAETTLNLIEMLRPDVVLMDIKMPGMDGIELTRQVKHKYPSCKVIMLTLYDQYLTQAMSAGARGYLLKDIKCPELSKAIRDVNQGKIVTSESIKANTQFDYKGRDSSTSESFNTLVEELQLVLAPPIEAGQLLRFAGRTEETLGARVLQMVGAWQEGTVMTIILNKSAQLQDVMEKFRSIPEIEMVAEQALTDNVGEKLLKKAQSMPRTKNRPRKTIFVTLEKGRN